MIRLSPAVTSRSRAVKVGVAALALLSVAACGGKSEPTTPTVASQPPSSSAPTTETSPTTQTSASTGSSESPSADESGSSDGSADAALKDPCKALTKEEASKTMGVKFTSAKKSEIAGTPMCTYLTSGGGSMITQVIDKPASVDQMVDVVKQQFKGAKITDVKVSGADEAKMVSGKISGMEAADILMAKGNLKFQVMAVLEKDPSKNVVKAAEAMIN